MSLPRKVAEEKGAALITALMLTALCLVIATALIYSVVAGSRVSAGHKRYKTVLAAAQGGVEEIAQEIVPFLMGESDSDGLEAQFRNLGLTRIAANSCLMQKMTEPTAKWSRCDSSQKSADPARSPDFRFRLRGEGASGFAVSAKIADAVPGNSDRFAIDLLDQGSSVTGNEEGIRPVHVPALFSISVLGEREDSNREKARLSVLYAY